uniref:Uncharacterized protein n=1 Tax=Arundo donax TaxID=35708 RepID=A0A0A9H3M8_ARUDO
MMAQLLPMPSIVPIQFQENKHNLNRIKVSIENPSLPIWDPKGHFFILWFAR